MILQEIIHNEPFLKKLYKLGFINYKFWIHTEIYLRFDMYIKTGNKKTCSIQWTADEFKVSTSTIYRVIKEMEL